MAKYFKAKYFSKQVIDDFLKIYVERYPDAIKNWHRAMTDEEAFMTAKGRAVIHDNVSEMMSVAKDLPFFKDYAAQLYDELMDVSGGGFKMGQVFKFHHRLFRVDQFTIGSEKFYSHNIASSELSNDVGMRLRDMLEGTENQGDDV
jgi:hypothetical protein